MDWQNTSEHNSRQNNECIANLSKASKYLLSPKLRKFESHFFYEKTVTPRKKRCNSAKVCYKNAVQLITFVLSKAIQSPACFPIGIDSCSNCNNSEQVWLIHF